MLPTFAVKLERARTRVQAVNGADAPLCLLLMRPPLAKMPLPMQRYDDPFLPWGKAIIDATRALLVGYVFDFAAYMAIGAAGAVALERTIAYIRPDDSLLSILHGPFWGGGYARMVSDNALAVDGVTLAHSEDSPAYERAGVQGFSPYEANRWNQATLHLGAVAYPLLSEEVLYAGKLDDFAEATAQAAAAWMNAQRG